MLITSLLALASISGHVDSQQLFDSARQRKIPIQISLPVASNSCSVKNRCKVAFLSPGYGLTPDDYKFLVSNLNALGFLTVSIQSVLPDDPQPKTTGNMIADRTPMWQLGVDNLKYVKRALKPLYPQYDWENLTLVGHSNGGDISAFALAKAPSFANTIITLDNRRYPLPRNSSIRVLSLRGGDFPADPGVLPNEPQLNGHTCIFKIENSKHNDMNDSGPKWLKDSITKAITNFFENNRCGA